MFSALVRTCDVDLFLENDMSAQSPFSMHDESIFAVMVFWSINSQIDIVSGQNISYLPLRFYMLKVACLLTYYFVVLHHTRMHRIIEGTQKQFTHSVGLVLKLYVFLTSFNALKAFLA